MDTFSVTSYEVVNKEKAKSVENNINGNAEGIGTKPETTAGKCIELDELLG